MKKAFVCVITLVLILSAISMPCAAATETDCEITYLEDGSYFVTTITTSPVARASNSTHGEKTIGYYGDNGVLQWTFVVAAMFDYTPGVESVCTATACDVEISDTVWSCTSKSASPSGASAVAHAEVIKKFLLVTVQTVPVTLTLTCDTYGNLS